MEDDRQKALMLTLNQFFDFSPTQNRIEDKVFRCKAIFLNEVLWDAIQNGLYDSLNEGLSVLLFQIGLKYGTAVGKKTKEAIPDIDTAVKFLETYGLMAGWAKFETSPIKLEAGKLAENVTVVLKDSFFAIARDGKKADSPRCFFVSGLLTGIADGLLGEGHRCIETKCAVADHDHCEFLIHQGS